MHMKNRIAAAAFMTLGLGVMNPASAELFTNPTAKSATGKSQLTGLFGTSTVTYDNSDGYGKADVDRTFLGASFAYGLSDKLDIYGAFALITKAEIEDFPDDDSGTAIAVGLRGSLPIQSQLKVQGYAQFLSIDEDYGRVGGGGTTYSLSGKETSLSIGAVIVKEVENITLYGGPELILLSDGKITYKETGFGTDKIDAERDDIIGFRAGAVFDAGGLDVSLGLSLVHESGFTLGVSKAF